MTRLTGWGSEMGMSKYPNNAILVDSKGSAWWALDATWYGDPSPRAVACVRQSKLVTGKRYIFPTSAEPCPLLEVESKVDESKGWLCVKDYTGPDYVPPEDPMTVCKPFKAAAAESMVPEWIVNNLGELGVKIGTRFFFLYKGESLEYESGGDPGGPYAWRPVGKREFGETCHAVRGEEYSERPWFTWPKPEDLPKPEDFTIADLANGLHDQIRNLRRELTYLEARAQGMDAWSLRGAEVHAEHAEQAMHSVMSVLSAMNERAKGDKS